MASNNVTDINLKTYDESLCQYFRDHIGKDKDGHPSMYVVYAPTNLAFRYAMKRGMTDESVEEVSDILLQTDNQMKLPMISIYRPNGFKVSTLTHEVLGSNLPAFYVNYVPDPENLPEKIVTRNLQRIFVDIPYQVDLWASDDTQASVIAQSLVFLIKKSPIVKVKQFIRDLNIPLSTSKSYKYNGEFRFRLSLDDSIDDNSELDTEESSGKLYRYTFSIFIEDAILARDTKLANANEIIVNIDEYESNEVIIQYDSKEDLEWQE